MFSIILFLAWDRVEISVRWEGDSVIDFITGVVEDENTTSIMVEGEKHVDRMVLTSVPHGAVTGHQPVPPDKKLMSRPRIDVSCHQLLLDISSIATIGCQVDPEMVEPDRHMVCLATYEALTCSCTDVTCPQQYLNMHMPWYYSIRVELTCCLLDRGESGRQLNYSKLSLLMRHEAGSQLRGEVSTMNTTTYITNPVPFPILPNAQTESYAMYGSVSEQCDLGVTDDNTFTVEHIPMKEVVDYNILVNGISAIKLLLRVGSEGWL